MNASMPSLRRVNVLYTLVQLTYWAAVAAFSGYQTALLLGRGFSSGDAGVFAAIRCLAGIIAQLLLGGWADRHPQVPLKRILCVCLGLGLAVNAVFYCTRPGFWGSALAKALEQETDTIIDLASKEYSKAVSAHLSPSTRLIGCIFAQQAGDKLAEKGTLCKMARGEMVRFLAERQAGSPEDLKSFDRLGFRFSPEHSEKDKYVFIKE